MDNFLAFFEPFMKGLITSLAPIVAAIGIVVNNRRASIRQNKDIKIKFQIEVINDIYNKYKEIFDLFISHHASTKEDLYKIQEELLMDGEEKRYLEYNICIYEAIKKTISFYTYRDSLLSELKININPEEMVNEIIRVYHQMLMYAKLVVYITKLFVITYFEVDDINLCTQKVIEQLKEKRKEEKILAGLDLKDIDIPTEEKKLVKFLAEEARKSEGNIFDDYIDKIATLDKKEKNRISLNIKFVIEEFCNNLDFDSSVLCNFDNQIAKEISRLIK